jgi:hypothetical protein
MPRISAGNGTLFQRATSSRGHFHPDFFTAV